MRRRLCQRAAVCVFLALVTADTFCGSRVSTDKSALLWSTLLGGSRSDQASGVAVDGAGNVYVTGWTQSDDFPTTRGAFDTSHNDSSDVFVLKLDPAGRLIYATLLGGRDWDQGFGLAVDTEGGVYLTGRTRSADFPARNAFDTTFGGEYDAFLAKLSPNGGNLIYATYLGGSDYDRGQAIAIDRENCAYLTGWTRSADFPTTTDSFCPRHHGYGEEDAFVAKVSTDGHALIWATYLGGNQEDWGQDIAVDRGGHAYVAVLTYSPDIPTTGDAFDRTYNGSREVYMAKMNAQGDALQYATFLGGSAQDWPQGLVVGAAGCVHLTGVTFSADFPTTAQAIDTTHNGDSDVFVATLDSTGSVLLYSTLLGGAHQERSAAMAIDGDGNLYLTGWTKSADFPTMPSAADNVFHGQIDAFIVVLNPWQNRLIYASFWGGSESDFGTGLDVGNDGRFSVVGTTRSGDFPTTPGAIYRALRGEDDIFVAQFDLGLSHP